MNLNAAGSLEDLTTQEENTGNTGGPESSGMCMSVQALKRLENLKIDKLKQIRRSTPPGRSAGNKLPALSGKSLSKSSTLFAITVNLMKSFVENGYFDFINSNKYQMHIMHYLCVYLCCVG